MANKLQYFSIAYENGKVKLAKGKTETGNVILKASANSQPDKIVSSVHGSIPVYSVCTNKNVALKIQFSGTNKSIEKNTSHGDVSVSEERNLCVVRKAVKDNDEAVVKQEFDEDSLPEYSSSYPFMNPEIGDHVFTTRETKELEGEHSYSDAACCGSSFKKKASYQEHDLEEFRSIVPQVEEILPHGLIKEEPFNAEVSASQEKYGVDGSCSPLKQELVEDQEFEENSKLLSSSQDLVMPIWTGMDLSEPQQPLIENIKSEEESKIFVCDNKMEPLYQQEGSSFELPARNVMESNNAIELAAKEHRNEEHFSSKTVYRASVRKRPFTCKECKKKFTDSRILTQHQRMHIQETFALSCDADRGKRTTQDKRGKERKSRNGPTKNPSPVSKCILRKTSSTKVKSPRGAHAKENVHLNETTSKDAASTYVSKDSTVGKTKRSKRGPQSKKRPLSLRNSYNHHNTRAGKKKVAGKRNDSSKHIQEKRLPRKRGRPRKEVSVAEDCFPCSTCGKRISNKQNLINHERIHTGERPFACRTCGQRFREGGARNRHERTHNGSKPFKCDICDITFTREDNLVAHLRRHGKKGKAIRPHISVIVIRPYSCDQCDETFTRSDILLDHKRLHSKKKFPCEECGQEFSLPRYVAKHKRTVHAKQAVLL